MKDSLIERLMAGSNLISISSIFSNRYMPTDKARDGARGSANGIPAHLS